METIGKRIRLNSAPASRKAKTMPSLAIVSRPVALGLTPIEVAARCHHLPGFVFFDSALETGSDAQQLSIVAARPRARIEGRDWNMLREAISARQLEPAIDDAIPHGFAAGFIEYDGGYCFGIYEDALIYRHADDSWHEVGEMRNQLSDAPLSTSADAP